MNFVKDYISDIKKEFSGYNKVSLGKDIMAGCTVTAVALPLALAFGVSCGASASSGLITAIIAGIIISVFSGAFYQISGPTGAMAAILLPIAMKSGLEGVFLAGLISGIFLLLAGFLKLGKLTSFIPMPVVTGFTSGIAIIIATGQIDNLFGVTSSGENLIQKLFSYGELGFNPNITTLLIGLVVIIFMFIFPKKWSSVVPSSLLAIILATAVSIIFKLPTTTVGEIPQSLVLENRLHFSTLTFENIAQFIAPAASIAMLGMIESLLCGASAGRMTSVKLKSDRELIAQGIGNIIVPFFGGVPATAAIARTSVAIKSGAQTRLTGIIHGLGLLLSMFLLAPIMSQIPLSALSGVLIVTAVRMNEWETIKKIFNGKFKGAIAKFLVTMIATVIFDLTIAILAGVVLSLFILIAKLSHLDIVYDKVDTSKIPVKNQETIKKYNETTVAYIMGTMIFANTNTIEEIPANIGDSKTLIISMRGVSSLDVSNAQALYDVVKELQAKKIDVMFCGWSPAVEKMMDRSNITQLVGKDKIFLAANYALSSMDL